MCQELGKPGLQNFREELSGEELEITSTGTTNYYEILRGFDFDFEEQKLRKYDQNIVEYQKQLNQQREEKITLKYFQYLAVLFVERYLDRYFTNRETLLEEFSSFVEDRNKEIETDSEKHFTPTDNDLDKLAFWMATGSGKTLILHINLWQFDRYSTEEVDNIILITPNSGLTNQHIRKFGESGIIARRLDPDRNRSPTQELVVDVVDIHKLREETGEKTIATDVLEGNNLVFIDEGHRGTTGEEWLERREEVIDEGFAFEYSATFGQALSTTDNKTLQEEYAKSIIYDYSYRYFHEDGFGKDYEILNISNTGLDESRRRFLVGNLLAFFEQKQFYEDHPTAVSEYNLEDPLWIFIGRTVSGSSTSNEFQERTTDVLEAVKFFHTVLAQSEQIIDDIHALINADTEITTEDGEDVFANRFQYLRSLEQDPAGLYADILSGVFQTTSSEGIELLDLSDVDGEIALRAEGSDSPFGVINIGDTSAFLDTAAEDIPEIPQRTDQFRQSLFDTIDEPESAVNVLLGAKKFVEGWDSMRVASMGLMNVGKSKGSEIIQMFGRGIRLRGRNRSLKRSTHLPGDHPPDLELLETLNVFGVQADYIKRFEEYLEQEGIPTGHHKRSVDIDVTEDLRDASLKNLRLDTTASFIEVESLELESSNEYQPEVDLYPKAQRLSSVSQGNATRSKQSHTLDDGVLDLLSWDNIYFDMQDYKRSSDYSNLDIRRSTLRDVLYDKNYTLYAPQSFVSVDSVDDVERIERIVRTILRNYISNFYTDHEALWQSKHRNIETLTEADPNIDFDGFTLRAPEDQESLVDEVDRIADNASQLQTRDAESSYPVVIFDRHIYQPQFDQERFASTNEERVKSTPPALNRGEAEFVRNLRSYVETKRPDIHQNVYLLRNQSRDGIGFAEGGGFYPDFILWVTYDDHQYMTFVDPHGMVYSSQLDDPKVKLSSRIKTIEEQIGDDSITLDSAIISRTNYDKLETEHKKDDFHDHHVFFKEDDYISELFDILDI